MCGLFGQLGAQLKEHSQNFVLNALNERGPDGRGIHIEQVDVPSDLCLTFLHTRLAIQDLSSLGHQPMGSPEGNLWLIFNGEIYNQFQLRQELQQAGFCFRSTSDTEVLLHGYRYWGNRLWGKLNGIFAVAIWDRLNAELILFCRVVPAMSTHKSLGNESIAARFELGSMRMIMIVSLRSPKFVRSPMPPEVLLFELVHAPLSEPVNRKFSASRLWVSRFQSVPKVISSDKGFADFLALLSVTTSR